jgi:hypothetical protein
LHEIIAKRYHIDMMIVFTSADNSMMYQIA